MEQAADGSYDLHFCSKGEEGDNGVLNCSKVMFATGRKPNTRGIGLEVGG